MHRSGSLRPIPDRPNYLRVELPERDDGQRVHFFRIPNVSTCARLAGVIAIAHHSTGAPTVATSTLTVEAACAVIGVAWWHPVVALDVSHRSFEDLMEFGALVWEELSAGVEAREEKTNDKGKITRSALPPWAPYNEGDISDLLTAIVGPILDAVVTAKEVAEAANFIESPPKED